MDIKCHIFFQYLTCPGNISMWLLYLFFTYYFLNQGTCITFFFSTLLGLQREYAFKICNRRKHRWSKIIWIKDHIHHKDCIRLCLIFSEIWLSSTTSSLQQLPNPPQKGSYPSQPFISIMEVKIKELDQCLHIKH